MNDYYIKQSQKQKLDYGYYIKILVVKENFKKNYELLEQEGSICQIYDDNDELIYEWKCAYNKSRFSNIIHHSNDKKYLIFTEDLYGYSVLELDTLKNIHYILPQSIYQNETFIWEDFHYNKENDYLAIDGCFWGHPTSIIIVDFKNPLEIQESNEWIDIHNIIDPNYEKYDDIEFIMWDHNKLQIKAENNNTEKTENITISINEITRR